MSGTGTIVISRPANELTCINPIVSITKSTGTGSSTKIATEKSTNLTCLNLTKNTGILPGVATLRYSGGQDVDAPTTLNPTPSGLQLGARVSISHLTPNGKFIPLFLGQLMKRMDQG